MNFLIKKTNIIFSSFYAKKKEKTKQNTVTVEKFNMSSIDVSQKVNEKHISNVHTNERFYQNYSYHLNNLNESCSAKASNWSHVEIIV